MADSSSADANWRPSATPETQRRRAAMNAAIRGFFADAGVLEVETPAASFHGLSDPSIESLATRFQGPGHPDGAPLFLHSSPEFPMKRLLASGLGAIYQICKVFRNQERGRLHNPEFTLLEWYRPGFEHHRLMDDVAELVCRVAGRCVPREDVSYGALFERHLGVDPHRADAQALKALAIQQAVPGAATLLMDSADAWLDLLLTHRIEPLLPPDRMTFVYDYPASQAALARVRAGNPPLAERFELYLGGMELANGFHELADAGEQRRRFQRDIDKRREQGAPLPPIDEHLLLALQAGLPDCAGVAVGLDRLLMWLTGVEHIDQVLSFSFDRA
jgi:lysyl-tRNA synthetase class 2